MIDLAPALWSPARPAIIRAARVEDIERAKRKASFLPGMIPGCFGVRVAGCSCTPAYATGDRSAAITVTTSGFAWSSGTPAEWVNGNTASSSGCFVSPDGSAVTGNELRFDLRPGNKIKITEAKAHLQSSGSGSSVWQWQGSVDGSSWTGIGPTFIFDQTASVLTMTTLAGNGSGYRFYRMLGASGNLRHFFINEFEFRQCAC